MNDKQEEIFFI